MRVRMQNMVDQKPEVFIRKLVDCFNEDEAVWRSFEGKRKLRGRHHVVASIPHEILDAIEWREAEREQREVRCIGFYFPDI